MMAKIQTRQAKPSKSWSVHEAIRQTEEEIPKRASGVSSRKPLVLSEEKLLKLAQKYFAENQKSLRKKYHGKYIAIWNNKVIDSDRDFSKLATRVYKLYGYQTIYMPLIDGKKSVMKIPSPRVGF